MLIKAIGAQVEQFPYTFKELQLDNPHTSFPKNPPSSLLEQFNVYEVTRTTPPQIDINTYKSVQGVGLIEGVWTQTWGIEQLPVELASTNIREQRDELLQDSDWVVSKAYELGETVPTAWATYRQALRDITTQEGFPYNVIWPTKE